MLDGRLKVNCCIYIRQEFTLTSYYDRAPSEVKGSKKLDFFLYCVANLHLIYIHFPTKNAKFNLGLSNHGGATVTKRIPVASSKAAPARAAAPTRNTIVIGSTRRRRSLFWL